MGKNLSKEQDSEEVTIPNYVFTHQRPSNAGYFLVLIQYANVPAETLFNTVVQFARYGEFSQGQVLAKLQGETPTPGTRLDLALHHTKELGLPIPKSEEMIVDYRKDDAEKKTYHVAWSRDLPLTGKKTTYRCHRVETMEENDADKAEHPQALSRSIIILYIAKGIEATGTALLYAKFIEEALKNLHDGIINAAQNNYQPS